MDDHLTDIPPRTSTALVVLIPVFNDWEAVRLVVQHLAEVCFKNRIPANVLLVNDGSTSSLPAGFLAGIAPGIECVQVLHLRRNLGHQRAIAVALAYIREHICYRAVVVMDGDGEDAPIDVPNLLRKFEQEDGTKVVFAARAKRSEGLIFRLFYWLYQSTHLVLTGATVEVGNFSILPPAAIDRLVAVSDLWNHYAASVFKARLPRTTIPLPRASRVCGQSKMNFLSLVVHGLSAISVYGDIVGVRLLVASSALTGLCLLTLFLILGVRFFTTLAIPGWATTAAGLTLVLMLQTIIMSSVFVLVTLSGRQNASFLPIRDYHFFVLSTEHLA